MFKHIRIPAALALCLMMTLAASVALAAPSLKLTVPAKEIRGNADYVITLNATEPGFASVALTQDGRLVAQLFENKEIHTKNNELTVTAVDGEGAILVPGVYTITAVMTDQFGVTSKEVSGSITVKLPKDGSLVDGVVVIAAEATPTPAMADSKADNKTDSKAASADKASSAKTPTPKPTPAPTPADILTYAPGTPSIGEEGYQIGAGVSDAGKTAKGYWALTSESTDAEIWAAMQQQMIAANVGENEVVYIYNSTGENRKRLGSVSGTSQGFNVISEVGEDGKWSLVEAFRVEDGAFVRGYIRSNKLRTVEPNPTYGLLIDKAAQTLVVFKDGARIGSVAVSTGLPTGKYPFRETPAGEFITVTRRGTTEYYGDGFSKYTIRVAGSYHLSEIPSTKKNGKDFSKLEGSLGEKATRGNIVIAHDASTDGGINAEWIWNLTDENKRVKVLILDDKDRDSVPVSAK